MKADERNTGEHAVKMPEEIGVVMPFRYAESPIGVEVRRMAVAVPMDMSASSFRCSDARLNEVYEFCKYTIYATSFAGLYIDGDRERIPYEADAYINMLGEQAVWADGKMAKATLLYLLDNPTWPTEWQLHMPMMAHGYWMATGDIDPIRENYGRLKKLLLRDRARESDGLLVTQWERKDVLCDIIDWPRCERDGYVFTNVNSVVNAFHIRALRDMAQLSAALGEKDDANVFAKEAEAKTKAFMSAFVDEDAGLVRDGEGVAHSSDHANIAAIAFGLLPEPVRGKVMERVRSRGMACSTYFSQYLLEACFAAGCGEYARDLMTADGDRSWLGMKKAGATMCMESWSGAVKPNQDWNHAWSSAPLNIITRFVLGVRVLEPGARKVAIEPDLCGMDFADGVVPTARGSVKVSADASNLVVETPVPARVVWQGAIHEVAPGRHEFNCRQAAVASAVLLKTRHFQRQIDKAAAQGGGRVVVPAGRHVVGQIDLKSNVELHLERGAVLEGAVGLENYRVTELPYSEGTWSSIVSAIGVTNIAVTGEGEILGNGSAWPQPENYGGNQEGLRPRGLFFADCNDIRLSDFTLRDAACWGVVFKCCDGVDVRRVKIDSHANANNDGFDVEAKNVVIADCDIDTGDDAICLKRWGQTPRNADFSGHLRFQPIASME